MSKKNVYSSMGFMALLALAILATAVPVFADNNTSVNQDNNGAWNVNMHAAARGMMKPAVFGKVTAVSGNTITIAGKQGFGASAVDVTYTVDATNAKIMKNNTAGTIASIVVGDTIVAQGTLTGTNLVAITINDSQMTRGLNGKPAGTKENQNNAVSPILGNGQPIVAGTVSSINGSTLTITNKSNVSYTVDATNAKIAQGSNTISLSSIAVGDMVVVQGTVNGNAIVASGIIDQTKLANANTTGSANDGNQPHRGFFAGIGSFFAHIFGF